MEQLLVKRQADANEMRAEADRRLAKMPVTPAVKPVGSPKAEESARNPDGTFAAKETPPAAPATPDKAPADPSAKAAVDRKFISKFDEKYRKSFEALPDDAVEELKRLYEGGLRQADYTQKTTSVAEREKALKEEEDTLRLGHAVRANPQALGAVNYLLDVQSGKVKPEGKARPVFDHITATPEEFAAHEEETRRLASDSAYERFQADLDARERAQGEKVLMAAAAKAAFYDTGDYDPQTVNAVYDKCVARGVKFTKDTVVEILKDFLPPPKAKEEPKKDSLLAAAPNGNGTSGASSLARAGGVTPLVTAPAFMQRGGLPANVNERLQEAVAQVNARKSAAGKELIDFGSR